MFKKQAAVFYRGLFRPDTTRAASFLNSFKNPCLSRNLDKSDMNALKVNYIQMEKYSLFSCCQRFRELLLEMPPKRVFREPKNAKEDKDYLDSCIPKATRYVTKWAYKIFGEWQSSRRNKDANFEERGFRSRNGQYSKFRNEYCRDERLILELLADKVCRGGV